VNLDDIANCNGIGRDVLESRIAQLLAEVRRQRAALELDVRIIANLSASNVQLNEQVTVLQEKCTRQLEQVRSLLACGYPVGAKGEIKT
jgi:hypothetical protein